MKKTLLLALMVFASFLMQFCTNTCGGGDDVVRKPGFVNAYIYNRIMHLNGHVFSASGTDSVALKPNDTLCLMFHVDVRTAQLFHNNSASALMACEPEPIPLPAPMGDSLNIVSLDVFNAQYPAGSDVSGVFRLYDPYGMRFYPLSGFTRFNSEMNTLFLALVQPPLPGQKRFRLSVHSGNPSKARTFDTPPIRFY